MPYRMLGYTARTFERMYRNVNFFSTKQQKLIVPEFYVLFNGTPALPDESVIRLSDSYITALPENSAEIVVKILDDGYNKDKEILKRSPTLHDYSRFIQIVRETMAGRSDKDAAAIEAVQKCLDEGILTDFLKLYGSEAVNMAFTEFNYEEYIEQIKKDFYEDGKIEGQAEALLEILSELGVISDTLLRTVLTQDNPETLKRWLKLAAKAKTIKEFEASIS